LGRLKDKILQQLDFNKQQLDKLTKWVEFDRVSKEEIVKILNTSINKIENIENLVEIDN